MIHWCFNGSLPILLCLGGVNVGEYNTMGNLFISNFRQNSYQIDAQHIKNVQMLSVSYCSVVLLFRHQKHNLSILTA